MKIFFISPFSPYRGGIAQFSDELVKSLNKKTLIEKINYKRLYPSFLFPGKSQFIDGYQGGDEGVERGIDSIQINSGFSICKKTKKTHDEVVILSVFWMSFFAPLLGLISKFSSKKSKKIALVHNLIPHEKRFFDSFLTRFYVNQQDAFIVLSEKVKSDVLQMKPSAKVLKLFHPLYDHFGDKQSKLDARKKLNLDQNQHILLFFGLIRDYKGIDVLIESLSHLDESYFLIIAGESYGSFEKYSRQIENKKLTHRILHIDRFISDSEVPTLFSAADICVLPYKTATQSGVTATAIHFDLPVVSTNVGGLSEYVLEGKTGFLVSPNDAEAFADSIRKTREELFLQMFENEIQVFKSSLTWEVFGQKLLTFVQSV